MQIRFVDFKIAISLVVLSLAGFGSAHGADSAVRQQPAAAQQSSGVPNDELAAAVKQKGDKYLIDLSYQDALNEYRHYMKLTAKPDPSVIVRIATCDGWLGRQGLSAREFERAAKIYGDNLDGLLAQFDAHLVQAEYDQALAIAEKCTKRFDKEWKGYMYLGFLHDKFLETENAVAAYSRAIELYPLHPERASNVRGLEGPLLQSRLYGLRGHCYYRLKKYREAVADCTKVLELEPGELTAYESRAEAYIHLDDFSAAERDLLQAVALKTIRARTYKQLGLCQLKRGDNENAVTSFSAAIAHYPRYAEAFHLRAEAYRKLGKPVVAASDEVEARKLGFNLDGAV
ncbi:MAG TPA: tetratricopeptide repeat protein [Oculatellaceae cyanobacterium]